MRLTTIFIVLPTVFTLGTLLFLSQHSQEILNRNYAATEKLQVRAVKEYSETALRARIHLLEAYGRALQQESGMAKLAVKGEFSGSQLATALKQLKTQTKSDFVYLWDPMGRGAWPVAINKRQRNLVQKGEPFTLIIDMKDQPALITLVPLKLYEEIVALVAVGNKLNGEFKTGIANATHSKVSFSFTGPSNFSLPDIEFGRPLTVNVEGNPFSPINDSTWNTLSRLSRLAVIALLGVLLSGLYFGFQKRFQGLLKEINHSASHLDKGEIREFAPRRQWSRELTELSSAFSKYVKSLKLFEQRIQESEREAILGQVSTQLTHDIKSALGALELTLDIDRLPSLSLERKQRARAILVRLRDITQSAVQKIRTTREGGQPSEGVNSLSNEPVAESFLVPLVEAIIDEKRIQHEEGNVQFQFISEGHPSRLVSRVQPIELKRVVSNLLDNARESLHETGHVDVDLKVEGDWVLLTVSDNGRGIDAAIIPKLGTRGLTTGKKGGSGLGLWHAKRTVESWGGTLHLSSRIDQGTRVRLSLPLSAAPGCFAFEVPWKQDEELVIVDDDPYIHALWKHRLGALVGGVPSTISLFSSPEAFATFLAQRTNTERALVVLSDLEFQNSPNNGFSILASLPADSKAFLMTNHFESKTVQEQCEARHIKLIPKSFLPWVEFKKEAS